MKDRLKNLKIFFKYSSTRIAGGVKKIEVISTVSALREYRSKEIGINDVVGLVPTMGFFHEGHLNLMRLARQQCDRLIVSVFVNPLQFGQGEDYDRYPRDLKRDIDKASSVGIDVLFCPSVEEMYPQGFSTFVEVEKLTEILCGKSRPGHFKGVVTVVSKLFNIIQPHRAFFGQKDIQQALVIKKLVRDLNFPVEISIAPIYRESDGLACSSRNIYLKPEERKAALILPMALDRASELISGGERSSKKIFSEIANILTREPLARVEYIEIRKIPDLTPLEKIEGEVLIALAVWFGRTRLIDNIILEV